MNIKIHMSVVIMSCLVITGCVGKYIAAMGPPRTIILRDTTAEINHSSQPTKTIRVMIFKDSREKKEFIGKVYNNIGEKVKDLQLYDGRSLESSLSFIIADSFVRNGYKVIYGLDNMEAKVDYEVSGVIWDFEIVEKTTTPRLNDSLLPELNIKNSMPNYAQINNQRSYGHDSNGSASIEVTIGEPGTKSSQTKEIWFKKEVPQATAQEMATILVAHIVTESNKYVRGFSRND